MDTRTDQPKQCETCAHKYLDGGLAPCSSCYQNRNWVSPLAYPQQTTAPDSPYCPTPEDAEPMDDQIIEPSHYTRWVIEPITFIMRNGFEFWRGNIVKYASRAGYKLYPNKDAGASEIMDLEKVIRYANMRINQLKGETSL